MVFIMKIGCGGLYTNISGEIVSPAFPNPYPPGKDCIHLISLPEKMLVNLSITFMEVDCQARYGSEQDYIELRDGTSEDSPVMGRFCGTEMNIPKNLLTTQNHLRLR